MMLLFRTRTNCTVISKGNWFLVSFFLLLHNILLASAFSDEISKELQYKLYLEGKDIGTMRIELTEENYKNRSVLKLTTATRIRLKALFIPIFSLDSMEETLIDEEKTFLYHSRTRIDGDSVIVIGNLKDNEFQFKINKNDNKYTRNISISEYDFTSQDSPEVLLKRKGEEGKFKILDFDRLEVIETSFKWIRDENIQVLGDILKCKVIEFKSTREKGTRWITSDRFGLLIREEGEDEDGKYSINLVLHNSLGIHSLLTPFGNHTSSHHLVIADPESENLGNSSAIALVFLNRCGQI